MPDLRELESFFTVAADHAWCSITWAGPDVKKGVDASGIPALSHGCSTTHKNIWMQGDLPGALDGRGPPYDDVVPFARALVERFPDRVIWGTDWPHPNMPKEAPDDGVLVDMIPKIAPTAALQQAAAGRQSDAALLELE